MINSLANTVLVLTKLFLKHGDFYIFVNRFKLNVKHVVFCFDFGTVDVQSLVQTI